MELIDISYSVFLISLIFFSFLLMKDIIVDVKIQFGPGMGSVVCTDILGYWEYIKGSGEQL